MNYTYGYNTTATADLSSISPMVWVFYIAVAVISIVAMWKIFQKAGKPGWHSIVPFLNMYDIMEISGYNGWLFLLLFVPIVNIVMLILAYVGLAKKFGKSGGFAVGLIFLNIIFMCILAFGSSKYEG